MLRRVAFVLIAVSLALAIQLTSSAARAGTEDEVWTLFEKFIAAQNAHDLKAVGEIVEDSPQFVWITRNAQTGIFGPVWGREAALKRWEQYYQGTWKLEPKPGEVKFMNYRQTSCRWLRPRISAIAPAGQAAQPHLFMLNQIYVKTTAGWRLASIFPVFVS
jgi:hypothetical protein